MKLILQGHNYCYAVEQSLLAFFPTERPVYNGGDPHTATVTLSVEGDAARSDTASRWRAAPAMGLPRWRCRRRRTAAPGSGCASGR